MTTYHNHIQSPDDLTTTYIETRAGFISIALEKNRRASPYVEEARVLKNRIKDVDDPTDLQSMGNIRTGLIAASGISDKAKNHLKEDGCNEAIKEFIKNFLIPAGEGFKEELIFRFLLTKGDSLGGSMRNVVGALAKKKLNQTIVASLKMSGKEFYWFDKIRKRWNNSSEESADIDDTKGLHWINDAGENRVLYYDITVPLIRNNIDIIILNESRSVPYKTAIKRPENFIALGELKGGIDPAGADEHWKTGKTAIDRIVDGFRSVGLNPNIFFIGAAIEAKMATEIYSYLESGYINNAANLTKEHHMTSITDWIVHGTNNRNHEDNSGESNDNKDDWF